MFNSIDTNGDGEITKAEWEAAAPPGTTTAESDALFSKIDTAGTGSITESELKTAFNNGVLGTPPTDQADSSTATASTTASATSASSSSATASSDTLTTDMASLIKAIDAYLSSATSANYLNAANISSLT